MRGTLAMKEGKVLCQPQLGAVCYQWPAVGQWPAVNGSDQQLLQGTCLFHAVLLQGQIQIAEVFNGISKCVQPRCPPVTDSAMAVVSIAGVLQVPSRDVKPSTVSADYYVRPFTQIAVVFIP